VSGLVIAVFVLQNFFKDGSTATQHALKKGVIMLRNSPFNIRNISYFIAALTSVFPFAREIFHIKGKAVPLQAWSDPEGSRKLRFPDFTTTQDGGKVVSLTQRAPLPPGNTPGTHFC
jgi:hypothetical protein